MGKISLSDINISYTALSTYKQCPYKFYKQVVERVFVETSWFRIGKAVHQIISEHYLGILDKPIVDRLSDLLPDVDEQIEAKSFFSDYTISKIQDIVQNYNSLKTEETYKFTYEGINYKGTIDLLLMTDSSNSIVDFKTSKPNSKTGKHYGADWLQPKFYAWMLTQDYKQKGLSIPYFYGAIYFLRTNTVQEIVITKPDIEKTYRDVQEIISQIDSDNEFTIKKNQFCFFCDFYNTCGVRR